MNRKARRGVSSHRLTLLVAFAALAACGGPRDPDPATPGARTQAAGGSDASGVPQRPRAFVAEQALVTAADSGDEWRMIGRDYAETRFSPLTDIDSSNVARLGYAWHYDTKSLRGLEATPLIANGVLYASTSWSNVFALDARTGEELWYWDSQADRIRGARACCDVVNRGVALYEDKVFVGVVDGRLVALDAATGRQVWDVQTTPVDEPYTITGAPRVVDGKVIIGNGGAELGVRGFVSAYDTDTGALVWRFYTVPGDPSKPFESKAMEDAARTWTGEWWKYGGGGTAWDSFAYDPAAKLLYVGTGNGSPWPRDLRSPGGGDNLYLASILALRVESGELAWHYQQVPGENWDFTAVQQMTLAEIEIDGRERSVLMQAPKNGFFYVLDRLTGELLSATPTTKITWASGIDMATGRPIETTHARYADALTTIQPGPAGAHNWEPMAFSPMTGLVYIPSVERPFVYVRDAAFNYEPGAWNLGIDLAARAGDSPTGTVLPESAYSEGIGEASGMPNSLLAWDVAQRRPAWRIPTVGGGGVLATAGNLVFQGAADGRLIAYAADSGAQLWEAQLGNGVMAAPSTYALGGKQYVSVLVGWGGAGGLYVGNPTGQYKAEGRLYTFALDGAKDFEPVRGIERPALSRVEFATTPERVARGALVYGQRCSMCHGIAGVSAGTIADLRYAAPASYDAFDSIVRGGALQNVGMPMFDWLAAEDAAAIKDYVLTLRAQLVEAAN